MQNAPQTALAALSSASVSVLNRAARTLRNTASAAAWKAAILDTAAHFGNPCLLLRAGVNEMVLEDARGLRNESRLTVLRSAAPAIEEALASHETVVAAIQASEISSAIAGTMEGASRVHIIPVEPKSAPAAALLVADAADAAPLELLASIAALAFANLRPSADLVPLAASSVEAASPMNPKQLRAKQFARVTVARMMLRHGSAVAAGQRSGDLYASLAPVVDAARAEYSARFLLEGARIDDYLHEELVAVLAGEDETKLGAEYPGRLG